MVGELERIWKESVVDKSTYYFGISLEEKHENPVRRTAIRTDPLPNMSTAFTATLSRFFLL
jgi:hypothetical protein